MKWDRRALRGARTGIDWSAPESLDLVDPYLVWFDLSDFAGTQPENARELRFLIEWSDSESTARWTTATLPFDQVDTLLELAHAGVIRRFELATPLAQDAGVADDTAAGAQPVDGQASRRPSTQPAIVAFIDYGCAFAHRKFRAAPGDPRDVSTRVLALWDQEGRRPAAPSQPGQPALAWRRPADFGYGLETLRDGADGGGRSGLPLNEYIARFRRADGSIDEERCYALSGHHAATRPSTHGTHLMDIATGCPDPRAEPLSVSALQPHAADIVFVQLPRFVRGRQVGGLLRAHVLDALHYILSLARDDTRVLVNLSYGAYAGPHDGSSMLEEAIDQLIDDRQGRLQVVVAAGNAYDKSLHAVARVEPGAHASFDWHNRPDDPSDSFVEIWFAADEQIEVRVRPPNFDGPCPWLPAGSAAVLRRDDDSLAGALVHAQHSCQGRERRMVLLAVAPTLAGTPRPPAPYGHWRIELHNRGTDKVDVDAWCERDDLGYGSEPWPRQGYFSSGATSQVLSAGTLSSLANGKKTIVVGARLWQGRVAPYSSTGAENGQRAKRADVLAPAEESAALPGLAAAATVGTGTVRLNGTSVAAAVVTRYLLDGGHLPSRPRAAPADPGAHPDEGRVPLLPVDLPTSASAAAAAAPARPARKRRSRRVPGPSAAG